MQIEIKDEVDEIIEEVIDDVIIIRFPHALGRAIEIVIFSA